MTTPTAATLMAGIQRMADVAQRRNQPEPSAMVLVREIRRLERENAELRAALETATHAGVVGQVEAKGERDAKSR